MTLVPWPQPPREQARVSHLLMAPRALLPGSNDSIIHSVYDTHTHTHPVLPARCWRCTCPPPAPCTVRRRVLLPGPGSETEAAADRVLPRGGRHARPALHPRHRGEMPPRDTIREPVVGVCGQLWTRSLPGQRPRLRVAAIDQGPGSPFIPEDTIFLDLTGGPHPSAPGCWASHRRWSRSWQTTPRLECVGPVPRVELLREVREFVESFPHTRREFLGGGGHRRDRAGCCGPAARFRSQGRVMSHHGCACSGEQQSVWRLNPPPCSEPDLAWHANTGAAP